MTYFEARRFDLWLKYTPERNNSGMWVPRNLLEGNGMCFEAVLCCVAASVGVGVVVPWWLQINSAWLCGVGVWVPVAMMRCRNVTQVSLIYLGLWAH